MATSPSKMPYCSNVSMFVFVPYMFRVVVAGRSTKINTTTSRQRIISWPRRSSPIGWPRALRRSNGAPSDRDACSRRATRSRNRSACSCRRHHPSKCPHESKESARKMMVLTDGKYSNRNDDSKTPGRVLVFSSAMIHCRPRERARLLMRMRIRKTINPAKPCFRWVKETFGHLLFSPSATRSFTIERPMNTMLCSI